MYIYIYIKIINGEFHLNRKINNWSISLLDSLEHISCDTPLHDLNEKSWIFILIYDLNNFRFDHHFEIYWISVYEPSQK